MSSSIAFSVSLFSVGVFAQYLYNDPTFSIVLAGGAGGLVRWATEREPWREGLMSVVVGALCAQYLGPWALGVVEKITSVEITDGTGKTGAFLMGVGGISLVAIVTRRLKAFDKK
ncbi:MAG: hypothetical protein ACPG4X_18615 [Pikeienuella sp.]